MRGRGTGRAGSARRLGRRGLAGARTNAEALAAPRGPLRRVADCWGLTPGLGVPHAEVRLRTRDGVVLAASYLPGPAGPRAELPAVVLAPGLAGHRTKPAYALLAERLSARTAVLTLDLRGHGDSGGRSSWGTDEAHDVEAGAAWLRGRGHRWVAAIGASMGAAAVLRAAGTAPAPFDAVCAVSAPAALADVQTPAGRALVRVATVGWYRAAFGAITHVRVARGELGGGIARGRPDGRHLAGVGAERGLGVRFCTHPAREAAASGSALPQAPLAVVGAIAPVPLLLVHGGDDHIFSADHARQLYAAAGEPTALWLPSPFGHAEDGLRPAFVNALAAAVSTVHATGRWPADPPAATL